MPFGGRFLQKKRVVAAVLAALLAAAAFTACAKDEVYVDGAYSARFKDYDSRGYQAYVDVSVEDGKVVSIEYDAVDKEGNLRSEDAKYRAEMEKVQGTYPEKYAHDLVNQYMKAQSLDGVDALAGATYATDSFNTLMAAVEENMAAGNTRTIILNRAAEEK